MGGTILTGATVFGADGVYPHGEIAVSDGRIEAVGKRLPRDGKEVVKLDGGYLLPGFIDTHVHGGGGYDCLMGRHDGDGFTYDGDSATKTADAHAAHGTTTLCLATVAADDREVERALADIGRAAADVRAIAGIHIEGSFLKAARYAGAQSQENFREPSVELLKRWRDISNDSIRIVNIAPEYGAAATEAIRYCRDNGITAASGHTGATYEQTLAAIDAGVRLAVHFTNGPCSTTYKPPGAFNEAVLGDARVAAELIADGRHLSPGYFLSILAAKRFNCNVVTDAMFPAGTGEACEFAISGKVGVVDTDAGVIRLKDSGDGLFGSILTMDRAFANVVSWFTRNIPGVYHPDGIFEEPPGVIDAIGAALPLFTSTPARLLGIEGKRGSLAAGKDADIVHLDSELTVVYTWVAGRRIPTSAT